MPSALTVIRRIGWSGRGSRRSCAGFGQPGCSWCWSWTDRLAGGIRRRCASDRLPAQRGQHTGGRPVGSSLGGVVGASDHRAGPGFRLADVAELVGDQPLPLGIARTVGAGREVDVVAMGEGDRLHRPGQLGGFGVGMHPHRRQIAAERLAGTGGQVTWQRPAGAPSPPQRAQHARGDGGAAQRIVGGFGNSAPEPRAHAQSAQRRCCRRRLCGKCRVAVRPVRAGGRLAGFRRLESKPSRHNLYRRSNIPWGPPYRAGVLPAGLRRGRRPQIRTPRRARNTCGSTAGPNIPPIRTSKCRCGPVEWPSLPT